MVTDRKKNLTKPERRQSMLYATWSVIVGASINTLIGPGILILLAVKAGAGEIYIGLLTFFFFVPVTFSLLQIPTVEKHGKIMVLVRWTCVTSAILVLYLFLPQLLANLHINVAMPIMLLLIFLRSTADSLGFAGWFPVLQDIVPRRVTGRFFATFRRIWQSVLLCLVLALAWFLGSDPAWYKFNIIFLFALVLCLIKIKCHASMYELQPINDHTSQRSSLRGLIKDFAANRQYRPAIAYFFTYAAAMGISMPFQIKFLKDIGYSDGFILAATAMVNAGAMISLKFWGAMADKFGNRIVFSLTHAGLIIVTLLWLFVAKGQLPMAVFIFALFLLHSVFNSGNAISQTRFIQHAVPAHKQGDITIINMINIMTWGVAPAIGGICLALSESFQFDIAGKIFGNYQMLFIVNALMLLIPHALRQNVTATGDAPTKHVLFKAAMKVMRIKNI